MFITEPSPLKETLPTRAILGTERLTNTSNFFSLTALASSLQSYLNQRVQHDLPHPPIYAQLMPDLGWTLALFALYRTNISAKR